MREANGSERLNTKIWPARLIQLLAVPGLLVAFYLLLYHNGALTATCTAGRWEDCGLVSGPDAPYASIGPIPVALIGLVGYALIFLAVWLADFYSLVEDYLPELLVGLTGLALLFTIGLTALEVFIIHAVCRYCLVSAGIIVLMFILAIYNLRVANRAEKLVEGGDLNEARTG